MLIHQIIDKGLRDNSKKIALTDPKHQLTYKDFSSTINVFAQKLIKKRLNYGDRVLLYADNSVYFMVAYFAIIKAGLIVVPVDNSSALSRISFLIKDCGAKGVFVGSRQAIIIKEYLQLEKATTLEFVFSLDELTGFFPNSFELIEKRMECEISDTIWPKISSEDIVEIIYTTGSTGSSKGVCLTHRNILAALNNINEFVGYQQTDHEVVTLPLTHSFGLNHVLCNLKVGGSAYIESGILHLKKIFNAIRNQKATGFPGTPASFSIIMGRYTEVFRENASSLRFIVVNSAPLPPALAEKIMKLLPHIRLMVYYGLTEASRSSFIEHSIENKTLLQSVGRASPNVGIAVLDESGKVLNQEAKGEVLVKAETVMHSYWNNAKATEDKMLNGWFKTGDLGYIDKNGYLFLQGRLKDMINIGGMKTSSTEINEVYEKFWKVEEFYAIGICEGIHSGEKIIAFVIKKVNVELSIEELIGFGRKYLDFYKVPSSFYFIESIPKSDTGKVKTGELKDIAKRLEKELC